MKLAFDYFSLGFQRIVFMIWGAQIAFLVCYLVWCNFLVGTTVPLLPAGYAAGGNTMAGAMVMAAVLAIRYTILTLLSFAAIALIVGYVRHYLVVLSYYDEQKYAGYKKYRSGRIPAWLMNFSIGQEAERERLRAIEVCIAKIKAIKEGTD
jgi:hypothetical protein